jgi:hypothetical protein
LGGITTVTRPKEKDYYLAEAIRNAEEMLLLVSDMDSPNDIDEERQSNIDMTLNEIKARLNSLLVAIDPERDPEDAEDEDDIL